MFRTRIFAASSALFAALWLGACTEGGKTTRTPPEPPQAGEARMERMGSIRSRAGWYVDDQGRVRIMHGFNMTAKVVPYDVEALGFGEDDAAFLSAHGFDIVRLGVAMAGISPAPGVINQAYLDSVERSIRTLHAHGIWTLLNFHQDMMHEMYGGQGLPLHMVPPNDSPKEPQTGFPFNYFSSHSLQQAYDDFFADRPGHDTGRGAQTLYVEALEAVAARLGGVPGLMGYDIYNEPFPGTQWWRCASPAGCADLDREYLGPFYARAVEAIRRHDPHTLVHVEPFLLFDFGAGAAPAIRDPGDAGLALSYHMYCLGSVLEVQHAVLEQLMAGPCGFGEELTMNQARELAQDMGGVPMMLTEFGYTTENRLPVHRAASLADSYRVGWNEWTYHSTGATDFSGRPELVHNLQLPPAGSNVDTELLRVLVRPRPKALAGVPEPWHYDRASGEFRLAWDTSLASGLPAPAGLQSLISVPHLAYPSGYTVEIRGGRVVSATDEPLLRVVAHPGATRVTIAVRPRP